MENPIKTIILDDEPFAVQLLEDYAQKISQLKLIYAGGDVYTVLELLKNNPNTLVFIDLQMPELSGIEIMQMRKNAQHDFIITSAYHEFALEAFKYKVIDFLVKPISFPRFYASVQKYMSWRNSFKTESKSRDIFIKSERKVYRINPTDIIYIEGLKDYIKIHTTNDRIVAHHNMKDIIKRLSESEFIRIHRSYIIALNKIKVVEGNRIRLLENIELPIGETYRKTIKSRFNQ